MAENGRLSWKATLRDFQEHLPSGFPLKPREPGHPRSPEAGSEHGTRLEDEEFLHPVVLKCHVGLRFHGV